MNSILWGNTAAIGDQVYFNWSLPIPLSYTLIQDGQSGVYAEPPASFIWGDGMLEDDPLFASGPMGEYYLSQAAAGQPVDSPCLDAGADEAALTCYPQPLSGGFCMDEFTTRSDHSADIGTADIGYHYPLSTPTPTETPTHSPTSTPTSPYSPTPTMTKTATPTLSPTRTPTVTLSPTVVLTLTPTRTVTLTPTVTRSPTRSPTATLTPTATLSPSPTLTPTASPEPTPLLGVRLLMPAHYFSPGEPCSLTAVLYNYGGGPVADALLFVILDIAGSYWFWDDWTGDLDYYRLTVFPGLATIPVIPEFAWPATGAESASGLLFWGALTDPAIAVILGGDDGLGTWSFGYGPAEDRP